MTKVFEILEHISAIIFFIRPQNPSRGVNFYRVLRFVISLFAFIPTALMFIILVLATEESVQDYTTLIIGSCVFFIAPSVYLLRWFFILNQRYQIARTNDGRDNAKGLAFYIGITTFIMLLTSIIVTPIRYNDLNSNQKTPVINQMATSESQQILQTTTIAHKTETAISWTQTPSNTPFITDTPVSSETPVQSNKSTIAHTPLPTDTAIATLTPVITQIPTKTPTPSNTPSVTPSSTITNTPLPTNTSRPTNTRTPSRTPKPSTTTYYIKGNSANLRADSNITSSIVASLTWGSEIQVIDDVQGQNVSGSTTWYKISYKGDVAYVHSSLVSPTRPPTAIPQAQTNTTNTTIGNQSNVPVPQAPAFTCDCSKTCSAMASCEEAKFQLNQCGCKARDGDGDGVPCESICPGG